MILYLYLVEKMLAVWILKLMVTMKYTVLPRACGGSKEPLPTPRHGLSATIVDGKIFAIGGGPEAGLSISNVNEVFNPNQKLTK